MNTSLPWMPIASGTRRETGAAADAVGDDPVRVHQVEVVSRSNRRSARRGSQQVERSHQQGAVLMRSSASRLRL
jgi:hypothetical protein